MGKTVNYFLLVVFLSALPFNSLQMLSIENGKVYIEGYNLTHVFQNSNFATSRGSSDSLHGFHSNYQYQHLHKTLTANFLNKKPVYDISSPVNNISSSIPSVFFPALSRSFQTALPRIDLQPLKPPPLLQTTVLLI
jgi:hypothetical protein